MFSESLSSGFGLLGFNTQLNEFASSAISFRLPSDSISAAASFRLTLVQSFRFRRSLGRPFHGSAPLPFRFLTPAVSAFFRLLLFRFRLLSLLFLPFRFLSVSASQWLLRCTNSAFALSVFPVIPNPVSRVFFPGFRTRLSVSFLSPFPVSLPQLFLRCLPYALCFRYFSLAIAFFRPLSFRFRLLSFPYFLFPSSRFSLTAVLPVHISSSVRPVAMPFFRFWYSAYCNSFLRMLFCLTVAYFSTSSPLRSISLGLRFRFRILSLETRH